MKFKLLLAVVAGLSACERVEESIDYENLLAYDSAVVDLIGAADTVQVQVQIAESNEQQTQGLMERKSLGENSGMLFVYDETQPTKDGFWMFRTRIPLDIAFADSTGTIVTIRTMEPCKSPVAEGCTTHYLSDAPYLSALEVNAGFFQKHGIKVGDRLAVRR